MPRPPLTYDDVFTGDTVGLTGLSGELAKARMKAYPGSYNPLNDKSLELETEILINYLSDIVGEGGNGQVMVNEGDTLNWLGDKITAGDNITITEIESGGEFFLEISADSVDSYWDRVEESGQGILFPITVDDVVRVGSGDVTRPGLACYADTNTGIYWPTDDVLGFVASGAEAFRIFFDNGLQTFKGGSDNYYGSIVINPGDADSETIVTLQSRRIAGTAEEAILYLKAIDSAGNGALVSVEANSGGTISHLDVLHDEIRFDDSHRAEWTQEYITLSDSPDAWTDWRDTFGEVGLMEGVVSSAIGCVTSISETGNPQLTGDVTVTQGTYITIVQVDQDIEFDVNISVLNGSLVHNSLDGLNNGDYVHLTASNHTDLTDGGVCTIHTHTHNNLSGLNDGDYVHLTASNHTDLTDGNNCSIHYHLASQISGITQGYVVWGTGTGISGEENCFWNSTNNRLGILNVSPNCGIHVGTGTTSMSLDTSNDVYITGRLEVDRYSYFEDVAYFSIGSVSVPSISFLGDYDTGFYSPHTNSNTISVSTGGNHAMSFDNTGYLNLTSSSSFVPECKIHIGGITTAMTSMYMDRYTDDEISSCISLRKSRSASLGVHSRVLMDDQLGAIGFSGSDHVSFVAGAEIRAEASESWATGTNAGSRLVFSVTGNGTQSLESGMMLDNNKTLYVYRNIEATSSVTAGTDVTAGYSLIAGSNLEVGTGHTINSDQYNLIGGLNNVINTGTWGNVICGFGNTISANYNILVGKNIVGTGDNSATFGGYGTTSGEYCLNSGFDNNVAGDYSTASGGQNYVDADYASAKGRWARGEWDYGHFFASTSLAGSVEGDSQCFSSMCMSRVTSSTSSIVMTSTGIGSTSPLVFEEGYLYTFFLKITGSVTGYSSGYWERVYSCRVWNTTGSGHPALHKSSLYTWSAGTLDPVIDFIYTTSPDTIQVTITPNLPTDVYWQAHIWGGTKIRSAYANPS